MDVSGVLPAQGDIVTRTSQQTEAKQVLHNLVCLDEVYKRINVGEATAEDYAFEEELMSRLRSYEKRKGTDLSGLIDLAKAGEFCPTLDAELRK